MKYRDVALFLVVASLFLNFFPNRPATASGTRTVILTFYHIPTDGWRESLDGVWYTLQRIEGVLQYTVDYDRNAARFKATVTFDEKRSTIEEIAEALTKAGYPLQERRDVLK